MTDLTQAIAEVKRIATSKTEHMLTPHNEHVATILNAVASDELIPLADHKLAVALMVEKAAQSGYVACAETRHVSLGNKVRDTICALAPAEVQALIAAAETRGMDMAMNVIRNMILAQNYGPSRDPDAILAKALQGITARALKKGE